MGQALGGRRDADSKFLQPPGTRTLLPFVAEMPLISPTIVGVAWVENSTPIEFETDRSTSAVRWNRPARVIAGLSSIQESTDYMLDQRHVGRTISSLAAARSAGLLLESLSTASSSVRGSFGRRSPR